MLERYLNIPKSVFYGWFSPFNLSFQEIVNNHVKIKDCHGFNPDLENVLDEVFSVIKKHNIFKSKLKSDLGISRADFLIYYVCFVDLHKFPEFEKFAAFSKGAYTTIKAIENEYNKYKEPVSIAKQLDLALDVSQNDITKAVLFLAIGNRAISRGLDCNLFKEKIFSKEEIESWKNKVKPFGYGKFDEDPQGDTYHFWHSVIAGMGREENVDFLINRKLKGKCLDFVYTKAADFVDLFRNKLILKQNLENHKIIDLLGYSVGRALVHIDDIEETNIFR